MTKYRLAILASHVIQYQAPLYRMLAARPEIDLTVYYCSSDGAREYFDRDMGANVTWNVSLLDGYEHRFLRNFSPFGRGTRFFRYIHPSIVSTLRSERPDALLLMLGWGDLTSWLAIAACRLSGIPLMLNGDSSSVPRLAGLGAAMRDRVLRALFRRAAAFLVTGTRNADYYLHYGANPRLFFPMPFAADNERFRLSSQLSAEERIRIRREWSADEDTVVFLFSGKLIRRKNPDHLLQALRRMQAREQVRVVFMGDGVLRQELETLAQREALPVSFLGFVNQAAMPAIYGAADVLVLPSSYEPRGIVVNEAMASGMTAIVSDRVGSVGEGDLLVDDETGFVVPLGDIDALAARFDALASNRELLRQLKEAARTRIASWNYEADVEGILDALRFIREGELPASRPRFVAGSVGRFI